MMHSLPIGMQQQQIGQWSKRKAIILFIRKTSTLPTLIQVSRWKRVVQLGLRVENIMRKETRLQIICTFSRHYTQLFPTRLMLVMQTRLTTGLSYGRRIDRPNYQGSESVPVVFRSVYLYAGVIAFFSVQSQHELSHNYKGQFRFFQ